MIKLEQEGQALKDAFVEKMVEEDVQCISPGRRAKAHANAKMALVHKMQVEEAMWLADDWGKASKNEAYIRINSQVLARYYPISKYYVPSSDEVNEVLLLAEDGTDVELLPRFTMADFCIYNSKGKFVPLELLPLANNINSDVKIFASGVVKEDTDNVAEGGVSLSKVDLDAVGERREEPVGIRIFTDTINQLKVYYAADLVFFSIRTNLACYKLIKPMKDYLPLFQPLLQSVRIAARVHELVMKALRPSRISFEILVRHFQGLNKRDRLFISKDEKAISAYLSVHGQVIINQLSSSHKKSIKDCALILQIKDKMSTYKHEKLYQCLKRRLSEQNSNPMTNKTFMNANHEESKHREKPIRKRTSGYLKGVSGCKLHFEIQEDRVSIGKSTAVDVILENRSTISRTHAIIEYNFQKQRWYLLVKGKNGVRVGKTVYTPSSGPVSLASQDLLHFGDKKSAISIYFLSGELAEHEMATRKLKRKKFMKRLSEKKRKKCAGKGKSEHIKIFNYFTLTSTTEFLKKWK